MLKFTAITRIINNKSVFVSDCDETYLNLIIINAESYAESIKFRSIYHILTLQKVKFKTTIFRGNIA